MHLAAKCTEFSSKLAKNWRKQHSYLINIHFARMCNYPLSASKQTFARIDFLRQGERLVAKRALIMLKFLLKRLQWLTRGRVEKRTSWRVEKLTSGRIDKWASGEVGEWRSWQVGKLGSWRVKKLASGRVNELIVYLFVFWHIYVNFDIRT